MRIIWTPTAWKDYLLRQKTDKNKLKRINELIRASVREPSSGIGNPEPLKHELQGFWSRRIDGEHRLVYSVVELDLEIISCGYHD